MVSESFPRVINNSVPIFTGSTHSDVTFEDLDKVFRFQETLQSPQRLISTSIYITRVAQEDGIEVTVLGRLERPNKTHQDPPYCFNSNYWKICRQISSLPHLPTRRGGP